MRRFNRTVTAAGRRADDRFLARDRPLGEARVLWEIGADGCELRALRVAARSRLRLPEPAAALARGRGLVDRRRRASADRRVADRAPDARRGVAERAVLDRRSDALARSLLEPLDGRAARRLVAAMGEVERLLTAGVVEIAAVGPGAPRRPALPAARTSPSSTAARTRASTRGRRLSAEPHELRPPAGVFLVADPPRRAGRLRRAQAPPGRAVARSSACGWPTSARGLGVGRRLLAALEARAPGRRGAARVRLDTNRRADRGDRAVPLGRLRGGARRSTTSPTPTTGSRSASDVAAARSPRRRQAVLDGGG